MRAVSVILLLLAIAVCGCDPIATKRVRLQLRPSQHTDGRVSVDAPDTREALALIDTAVTRHGFERTHDYPNQDEHGFIRRYSLSVASNRPIIACHIELIALGMEIRFGEFGAWTSSAEAKNTVADLRAALIEKYGESHVR